MATTRIAPAQAHSLLHRDVAMVLFVAAIFILAVVYSVFSATTIGSNISTDGTLTVSGVSTLTGAAYASSTLQATGDGLFYDQLSAGASTNTPTTTFNVTGSGYFTAGLGVGYATTGSGNLLVNDLAVIRGRLGVNATTSPTVEFGVTGSGYFTAGLGVGYATTGTGQLRVLDVAAFDDVIEVRSANATSTFSAGLSAGGITTTNGLAVTSGRLNANGVGVLAGTLGVGTTSPAQEFGITGDAALGSGATTTISAESTAANTGGCIELQSAVAGEGTRWVRIYVGGHGATTSDGAVLPAHVLTSGGRGILVIEEGRCQ